MTSGPRVNTSPLPGPLPSPAMAAGHPNNKHINDAIYAAAEQLRDRARDRRKIIFLISDGQNAKNNTHSYNETLEAAALRGHFRLRRSESARPISIAASLSSETISSRNTPTATGGDIFYGSSRDDLEGLYARVSEQARNQYTIAYSGAQNRPFAALSQHRGPRETSGTDLARARRLLPERKP